VKWYHVLGLGFGLGVCGVANAGLITLNFGDATINARPAGVSALPYLTANGVSVSAITPGTRLEIWDDRDPYNQPFDTDHATTITSSHHNFLWHVGSVTAMSYDLTFSTPISEVSFFRFGSTGGAATPAWSVQVFNGATQLAQVGQGINGFFQDLTPDQFSFQASALGAPQITHIRVNNDAQNFAAYPSIGVDDLSFTPVGAPVPEPSSIALLGGCLAGLGLYRARGHRKSS